ncbi:MAG: bile acid:sodium symporter [Planctomycetes bacterium]|nr:bile acid:sodium symporter [Planctomycetota bacterium]
MKKIFLPLGLVIAMAVGMLYAPPGSWLFNCKGHGFSVVQALVMVIFLISGYKLRREELRGASKFLPALGLAFCINLLVAPLIAYAVGRLMGASDDVYLGLVAMSCVPTTLSSCIVITRTAGGNALLALMMNVSLSFIGVFVLPFTISWCLNTGAAIDIDTLSLFLKIAKFVIAPLLVGVVLRQALKGWNHWILDYLPSVSVILTVWMAISNNSETLYSTSLAVMLKVVAMAMSVHIALLFVSWLGGRLARFERGDAIALTFVAAQKTLPVAITVLYAIAESNGGVGMPAMATLTCVVFHFGQIMGDSFIASYLSRGSANAADSKA